MMKAIAPLIVMALAFAACAHKQQPAIELYDRPYLAAYHYPLVSPGTKFAALPPAVQNSIRAETGTAEIEDIIRDTNSVPAIYRVYFAHYNAFPPLYIAADGSILNEDRTVAIGASQDRFGILTGGPTAGITLGDLPPKVVRVIQTKAPDAEIDTITRQTHGDQTTYTISFKGKQQRDLVITNEGVVTDSSTQITIPRKQ